MPSIRPYSAAEHLAAMPSLAIPALFSVEGKVCFVTGGSRGIGLMIAKGSYSRTVELLASQCFGMCQAASYEPRERSMLP